jgi:hypothetical protein
MTANILSPTSSWFSRMVMSIDQVPIHHTLEEVTMLAGHKVLKNVDDNSVLIVGDAQGTPGQQPRPCPIQWLDIKNTVPITH